MKVTAFAATILALVGLCTGEVQEEQKLVPRKLGGKLSGPGVVHQHAPYYLKTVHYPVYYHKWHSGGKSSGSGSSASSSSSRGSGFSKGYGSSSKGSSGYGASHYKKTKGGHYPEFTRYKPYKVQINHWPVYSDHVIAPKKYSSSSDSSSSSGRQLGAKSSGPGIVHQHAPYYLKTVHYPVYHHKWHEGKSSSGSSSSGSKSSGSSSSGSGPSSGYSGYGGMYGATRYKKTKGGHYPEFTRYKPYKVQVNHWPVYSDHVIAPKKYSSSGDSSSSSGSSASDSGSN